MKRLYLDVETSPNIGLFWSAGIKQKIDYENIIKERAIICICYKWEGDKEVHSLTWDKDQDDEKMLRKFMKIANTADELVGHNLAKYDMAWIRTRCLYHEIDCFPEYTMVDTLKYSRSKFRFNSNRLDYIGKYLGVGKKIHTDFDLWKNIVLHKSKESLKRMVNYCKGDVLLLQKVYNKMKNHIPPKSHYGMQAGGERHSCSECGSNDLAVAKRRMTAAGTRKIQFQCNNCGKYTTCPERKK